MRVVLQPAFDTTANYTTGTATFTKDSATVTFATSTLITQGIQPGQRIKNTSSASTSNTVYEIESVDTNTQVTLNKVYGGTTQSAVAFTIFGRERYILPVYMSEIAFAWHEDFGGAYILDQVPERDFFFSAFDRDSADSPDSYYLVDPFGVERQPSAASAVSIVSSSTEGSGIIVRVYGIVSSVPDHENLTVNGTTRVDGTKAFSFITRIVKSATTTGRITVSDQLPSAGSGSTLAVLPAGQAYTEPIYERIGLHPIPDTVIPINLWGYRAPYELVDNRDVSEWGPDFDNLEILLASAIGMYEERQKEEGDKMFVMYQYALSRLKHRNVDRLDYLPELNRKGFSSYQGRVDSFLHSRLRYRQLGPKYGPMSVL